MREYYALTEHSAQVKVDDPVKPKADNKSEHKINQKNLIAHSVID